jgi:hypothetical protein
MDEKEKRYNELFDVAEQYLKQIENALIREYIHVVFHDGEHSEVLKLWNDFTQQLKQIPLPEHCPECDVVENWTVDHYNEKQKITMRKAKRKHFLCRWQKAKEGGYTIAADQ